MKGPFELFDNATNKVVVAQRVLSNTILRPNPIKIVPITLSIAMTTRRCFRQLDSHSVAFVNSKNQREAFCRVN